MAASVLPTRCLLSHKSIPRPSALRRLSTLRSLPAPYPTTNVCPSPTCACTPTPTGLDIDHKRPLAGTKPPYAQHIVVCTGRDDWPSRIEDEEGPNLAKELKKLLGPKGQFHDRDHPILITNASLPTTAPSSASAYLFPAFQHVPHIDLSPSGLSRFVRSSVLADAPQGPELPTSHAINAPIILICGHGGRDQRCGIFGPLLQAEFRRALVKSSLQSDVKTQVALVSHIGGHKFAGNVIVYFPPGFQVDGEVAPLAGQGVWYGRVEPRHVEGIVAETVGRGRVVKELVRGWTEWGVEGFEGDGQRARSVRSLSGVWDTWRRWLWSDIWKGRYV
ncbi:hypothetical protein MMC15_003647 [Xylographa vitiligo]|nr:hypothetical protein [Xylographa vitiligo]